MPRKDLKGQVFGRLRVVRIAKITEEGRVIWLCHCDPTLGGCDERKRVPANQLTMGRVRSCGCLRLGVARVGQLMRHALLGSVA